MRRIKVPEDVVLYAGDVNVDGTAIRRRYSFIAFIRDRILPNLGEYGRQGSGNVVMLATRVFKALQEQKDGYIILEEEDWRSLVLFINTFDKWDVLETSQLTLLGFFDAIAHAEKLEDSQGDV